MTSQSKNNRLLPLTVIEAAAGGDVEAINAVLKHYAGYIARLSMRELYDEYGNPHLCVDEELRRLFGSVKRWQRQTRGLPSLTALSPDCMRTT